MAMKTRRGSTNDSSAAKWIPAWVAVVTEIGRIAAALIGRL
jgi:hypothetical protein